MKPAALFLLGSLLAACNNSQYTGLDTGGSSITTDVATLAANGAAAAHVAVHLRRGDGLPITQTTVSLQGELLAVSPNTAVTDATGGASFAVTSTYSGQHTLNIVVQVTNGTLVLPEPHLVLTFAHSTKAVRLDLSGVPGVLQAGRPTALTVRALDANNGLVTDYAGTVRFTSSDSNAVLPAAYTFTPTALGVYQAPQGFLLTRAGLQSLTVTDGALTGQLPALVVEAGPAQALQVSGDTAVVAGVPSSLRAMAVDVYGNIASAYRGTVTWTSSDARATLPADYALTAANAGVLPPQSVTHRTAGTAVVHAMAVDNPNLAGDLTILVNAAALSGGNTVFACTPTGLADGMTATLINLTARDAFGNGVPQVSVSFTAGGLQTHLTAAAGDTDAQGVFSSGITSGMPQSIHVGASVAGLALSCTTTYTRAPCFSFTPRAPNATGAGPTALVTGDINHDGRMDVAIADAGESTVEFWLRQSDGTFARVAVPVGSPAVALQLADLNHDGRTDAVVGCTDGGVRGVLQQVDGTFVVSAPVMVGGSVGAIALSDFNRDGNADIAVLVPSLTQVQILLGSTSGSLASGAGYATGPAPGDLAVADLNGDGKVDVISSSASEGAVSLLLGNGNGGLTARVPYASALGGSGLAVGDLDHDGKLDVLVANEGNNTIGQLLNRGNGTLGAPTYVTAPAPHSVRLADMDGDGWLDAAVSTPSTGELRVLRQRGGRARQSQYDTVGWHTARFDSGRFLRQWALEYRRDFAGQ